MHNRLIPQTTAAKVISLSGEREVIRPINKLIIPVKEGHRFLDYDNIIRLESSSNYTMIYMKSGKIYLVSKTMKSVVENLSTKQFVRVHHSHVVNVNAIALITKESIMLVDDSKIPVSRAKRKSVFQFFGI